MWIFLPDCMVSIVAHRTQPDALLVRARVAGDVSRFALRGGFEVSEFEDPNADYRFRAVLPRVIVMDILANHCMGMDYANHKGAIAPGDRVRHDWYMDVWDAGYRVQGRARVGAPLWP